MSAAATESPIGPYDPETTFLVTAADGSQSLHSRRTRHGSSPYAPLSWWRSCGFTSDEKVIWSRVIQQPEHALLLVGAGFTVTELHWATLGSVRVGDVLTWLHPYRTATGRLPKAWGEFERFIRRMHAAGPSLSRVSPFLAARYMLALETAGLSIQTYSFAASSPGWAEAIAAHCRDSQSVVAIVRALMQLGATPDALGAILGDERLTHREAHVERALGELFRAGEFTADAAGYARVRELALLLAALRTNPDAALRLYFTVDRARLVDAVLRQGIRDLHALEGIFDSGIAAPLVGGYL